MALRPTPLVRKTPLKSSSLTLSELRAARGAPLRRKSGLKADPAKTRAWQQRSRKPLKQTVLRAFNPEKRAKRVAHYNRVIASDFHKKLRYDAFMRAGGLCECKECVAIRNVPYPRLLEETARIRMAWTPVPVWFTKKGGEPWRRFRSTEGEVHHDSYKFFGDENPAELELVRWTWKVCHRRIEAEHGTRRRFLSGK